MEKYEYRLILFDNVQEVEEFLNEKMPKQCQFVSLSTTYDGYYAILIRK